MTSADWNRVREIFESALARPASERDAFVEHACSGDAGLRAEVTSLLSAHDEAIDFIEAPVYEAAPDLFVDDGADISGRTLGHYIIRHEIGRGGMGVVYLADDTRLARRVALKAIAPGRTSDPDRRTRIRHEARAAAVLSHPGIATVYALEEIDSELYLAFEYVPGPTLRALIESGPLPIAQIVEIGRQLAQALAAAHAQGVVHRDLKPENVVRTASGIVKVLDFGVARVDSAAGSRLTAPGSMVGTPAYMSPEQIRGGDADFRADMFALGLVMYEMATGANPFEAATPTATIARILEADPPPLPSLDSTGVDALDRIVRTCLMKRPEARYPTTQALVADLERLHQELSGQSVRANDSRAIAVESGSSDALTPRWWWAFHQVIASVVYALMLYPAWRARLWIARPFGLLLFFTLLTFAALAASLRLHLWFTARFYPSELFYQRGRVSIWTRLTDAGFCLSLVVAALAIGGEHPEIATLFVAVAIAAAVAAWLIEPTTTRAAFKTSPSPPSASPRA